MKSFSYLVVVVMVLMAGSASAQFYGFGQGDTRSTLAIQADGSCSLTNESVMPRKFIEMQVAAWDQHSKRSEASESEDETATPPAIPPPPKPEPKDLTDEQLASKLRALYEQRRGFGGDAPAKIEKVEVTTNSVRIVNRQTFGSLKDLLSENLYSWGPNLLMTESARFETDTNHNLRITFTPSREAERYSRSMSRSWKSMKMNYAWKLLLPGKVLTSGFPTTEANQTGFDIDTSKPETLEQVLKLTAAPLVITAELGGLKLDEPLESKKLQRASRRAESPEPDVPITDAAPGFQAEPIGLTISTVHYFADGKERFKNRPQMSAFSTESPGTTVSAKLFPPKGRLIRSVSELRVKAAKDDQGRAIPAGTDSNDEEHGYSRMTFSSNDQDQSGSTRVQLHLGLPAPDAKAIDQLEAEAVALTIGGWKEMVITNVQADTNKPIDLGEVLAEAKLIIKKVNGKGPQKILDLSLEGPAAINQLEVKVKTNNRRGGSSNTYNQHTKTSGKQVTRSFTLQSYEYDPSQVSGNTPLVLLVRYPQDAKRERVRFKLSALDLL